MQEYRMLLNEDEVRYILDALNALRYGDTKAKSREFNTIEKLKENIRWQRDEKTNKVLKENPKNNVKDYDFDFIDAAKEINKDLEL